MEKYTEENQNVKEETIMLDPENVYKLFRDCMFNDSEIRNGVPTLEYTYVDGISHQFVLNTKKVNENKEKIAKLIDLLPVSRIPQTFVNLCIDKSGRLWTGDQSVMELLMVLGLACGIIEYTCPREDWKNMIGGVPVINKTSKDLKETIVGESPEEFSKYLSKEEKKKAEEEKKQLEKLRKMAKETFEIHYEKAHPVFEMFGYSMGIEDDNYYLYDKSGEKLCELSITPFLGGFSYEGVVNDTRVEYGYSEDGVNSDGSIISRNIITVDNMKKRDETYSGKFISFELGVGLHEVADVPRLEVKIIKPDTDEKITTYNVNPYDLSLSIENDFGPYGNYEDGTKRTVHYSNLKTTPFVNEGPLLLHESQEKGAAYNIYINRENNHPETPAKYMHCVAFYKKGNRIDPTIKANHFDGKENADILACEYLKTSRVKNLYNHILKHIESELPGSIDYIHQNYPFTKDYEDKMKETPSEEIETLVNSVAIKGADVSCEKEHASKKELKQPKE